jgi:cysteine sulfinate desulfinase/cysteine desulfurase-like protein
LGLRKPRAAAPYIIFTSCATESNNDAIAAALKANPTKRHVVTSQVEHSLVLNYCKALCNGGFIPPFGETTSPPANGGINPPLQNRAYRVTYLPVDREGLVDL